MAQKPAKRHALAYARLEIGLSQVELADLLGCSTATVQRIEQGTLALSEELALKIQEALDISASWLLANNLTRVPITPTGGFWNRLNYEFQQASQSKKDQIDYHLRDQTKREEMFEDLDARRIYALYRAMMKNARGELRKRTILMYRVEKAFEELKKDFPPDKEIFEELNELGMQKTLRKYEAGILEASEIPQKHFASGGWPTKRRPGHA